MASLVPNIAKEVLIFIAKCINAAPSYAFRGFYYTIINVRFTIFTFIFSFISSSAFSVYFNNRYPITLMDRKKLLKYLLNIKIEKLFINILITG